MPGRIKPHQVAHNHPHDHQHLKPIPPLAHLRRQDIPSASAAPFPEAAPAPIPEPIPIPAPESAPSPSSAPTPAATSPASEPTTTDGGFLFDNNAAPSAKSQFVLHKQTIIWLVVISVIVLATLIIVACLLCRCKRRRNGRPGKGGIKRHPDGSRWHPSLEVKDGRNEFQAWNRNAPSRASNARLELQGMGGAGEDVSPGDARGVSTWETEGTEVPLVALVRPRTRFEGAAGVNGSAVMEPVVVDYANQDGPKKNSRYYSNLSAGKTSIWKRISQIGRAY